MRVFVVGGTLAAMAAVAACTLTTDLGALTGGADAKALPPDRILAHYRAGKP
jgi:hypothetical protein